MAGREIISFFLLFFTGFGNLSAQERPQIPAFRIAKPGEKVDITGTVSFITNRNAIAVGKQTKESATAFLNVPTSELKYGEIVYQLKGSVHDTGKLDETILLGKRSRLYEESSLAQAKDDVVVYLHGYNNSFDAAVQQGVLLWHDLALSMQMMVFSWASKGTPVSYHLDRLEIEKNAPPVAEFILKLTKSRPKGSVNLVVHSMGNDVFLNAIQRLETQGELKNIQFGKVILAAPDVAPKFFSAIATKLVQHSERVVHYFSTKDRPIFFSRFANPIHGVRAGARLVEVPGLEVVDVDQVNSAKIRLGHGYFAAVEEILNDISQVLADDTSKKTVLDRQKGKVEEVRNESGYSYFRFK